MSWPPVYGPPEDPYGTADYGPIRRMVKRATKKRRTQAGAEERYLQKVDRAVSRYGATAVAKYFQPGVNRTGGYYGRFAGPGAELKFFDTSLSFSFDATGEVPATGQLNLIPQGVTESTRVGRKCVLKSIMIRGIMTFAPSTAANASTNCFLYVVLDKQCNGAAAGVGDVFTSNLLPVAMHNLSNSQRFVILKKMKWNFSSQAGVTTAYNNVTKTMEMYKKCTIPLEFSSTTGAITELRSNNVFLLAGSDNTTDDLVSFAGTCRVRFSDGS